MLSGGLGVSLDEGEGVVDEGLGDTVVLGVDPLQGDLLLEVGHLGQVEQLGFAGVLAALAGALKAHHLVGLTGDGGLHSGLAGQEGLVNIGAGGHVRPAALEEGELNAPDLSAGLLLDHTGQQSRQTAQLSVSEAVGGGGLGLRDEGAVGVVDALRHGHDAVAVFLVNGVHIGQELVHVEVHLGQVDQVGRAARYTGQSGGASQPAGVTAHDLNDGHHTGVIHPGVLVYLSAGGGDILGGGGEAGAMVGAEQVVVNGLGHTHDAALVAHLLHILGNFVAGVHGVVAAVVEEVAHIVFFENLQDTLVVGVVLVGVRNLIAAGAQLGGGGVEQQLQLLGVLLAHVVQLVVEHSLDAVSRSVYGGDVGTVQSGADDSVGAGVDDRGGAAGLTDDQGALQCVAHVDYLQIQNILCGMGDNLDRNIIAKTSALVNGKNSRPCLDFWGRWW